MPTFVEAAINYVDAASPGGAVHGAESAYVAASRDTRTVRIHDARAAGHAFSLERNGFRMVRCPVDVDFADPRQIAGRYRPRMRALVRALTGASRTLLFGEMIRREGRPDGYEPAFDVHLDFDEASVRTVIRAVHPEPERLLAKRLALINLWRPILPVERSPLAVCDASTVSISDLRAGLIGGGSAEPVDAPLSGYTVIHNPAHRWWFYPDMQPDEVLVFKLVDSDPEAVQFTAHAAFDHPGSAPDAAPRQSIETRIIAFFD